MSGNATNKLHEATEAFMSDFESARETMIRIAQIQAKMSQCMDECLAEFRALFPGPLQQPLHPTNGDGNLPSESQEDLPQMVRDGTGTRYLR